MTEDNIKHAIAEAERFIEAAAKVLASDTSSLGVVGTRKSGACRRASVDLTRALADMRRSQ